MSTQMKRQEIPKGSIYFLVIFFQKGRYWRCRKKIITIREYSNIGTMITNSSPPWYIITDTVAWVVVCGQQMDKRFSFNFFFLLSVMTTMIVTWVLYVSYPGVESSDTPPLLLFFPIPASPWWNSVPLTLINSGKHELRALLRCNLNSHLYGPHLHAPDNFFTLVVDLKKIFLVTFFFFFSRSISQTYLSQNL